MIQHDFPRRRAAALAVVTALATTACGSSMGSMAHDSSPTSTGSMSHDTMDTSMGGMDHGSVTTSIGGMDMPATDGTKAQAGGYALHLTSMSLAAGVEGKLVFHIAGPDGKTPEGFAVEQTKPLHLIVVRSDLTGYQHLHPTEAADGMWSTPVTLPSGGTWRVIADFTPIAGGANQTRTVLGGDVTVAGAGIDRALPDASKTADVDGYTVTLKGDLAAGGALPLTFAIAKAGQPVDTLEPYLGAFGHLVALRQSDLAYTHLHPSTNAAPGSMAGPNIDFAASVPTKATYRLFLQFQIDGKVHTAEFTASAT